MPVLFGLLGIALLVLAVEFGHVRPKANKQAKKGADFLVKEE